MADFFLTVCMCMHGVVTIVWRDLGYPKPISKLARCLGLCAMQLHTLVSLGLVMGSLAWQPTLMVQPLDAHARDGAHPRVRFAPLLCAARSGDELLPPRPPRADPPGSSTLLPLAVLMMVPLAWGTYGVAIKELYLLEAPPPELFFTVLNYVVSSITLTSVAALVGRPEERDARRLDGTDEPEHTSQRSALWAGAELGGYLFIGSTLQVFGMRQVRPPKHPPLPPPQAHPQAYPLSTPFNPFLPLLQPPFLTHIPSHLPPTVPPAPRATGRATGEPGG